MAIWSLKVSHHSFHIWAQGLYRINIVLIKNKAFMAYKWLQCGSFAYRLLHKWIVDGKRVVLGVDMWQKQVKFIESPSCIHPPRHMGHFRTLQKWWKMTIRESCRLLKLLLQLKNELLNILVNLHYFVKDILLNKYRYAIMQEIRSLRLPWTLNTCHKTHN